MSNFGRDVVSVSLTSSLNCAQCNVIDVYDNNMREINYKENIKNLGIFNFRKTRPGTY